MGQIAEFQKLLLRRLRSIYGGRMVFKPLKVPTNFNDMFDYGDKPPHDVKESSFVVGMTNLELKKRKYPRNYKVIIQFHMFQNKNEKTPLAFFRVFFLNLSSSRSVETKASAMAWNALPNALWNAKVGFNQNRKYLLLTYRKEVFIPRRSNGQYMNEFLDNFDMIWRGKIWLHVRDILKIK